MRPRTLEDGPGPERPGAARPATLDGHQCHPSDLAGCSAHVARKGTTVVCACGKRWRVTKRHHGPHGAFCGCGWERL